MFGRGKVLLILGFVFVIIAALVIYPYHIINFISLFHWTAFDVIPYNVSYYLLPLLTFPAVVIISIKAFVKSKSCKMFCFKSPFNMAFLAIAVYEFFYAMVAISAYLDISQEAYYLYGFAYSFIAFAGSAILFILMTLVNKKHANNPAGIFTRNIILYPLGVILLLFVSIMHISFIRAFALEFICIGFDGFAIPYMYVSSLSLFVAFMFFVAAGIVLTITLTPTYWQKEFDKHPEYGEMLDKIEKEKEEAKYEEEHPDEFTYEQVEVDPSKYDGLSAEEREIMMILNKNDKRKVRKSDLKEESPAEKEPDAEKEPEVEKEIEAPKKAKKFRCPKCGNTFEGNPERCPHCNSKFKW